VKTETLLKKPFDLAHFEAALSSICATSGSNLEGVIGCRK
jgi:hypothetical protein